MLKYFILGFFVKVVSGFDDALTRIPIIANLTRTRTGKIAFSIGTLLAIFIAIFIAIFFASLIKQFPFYRYIAISLIFLLALLIYFDVFVHKPREETEKEVLKIKRISARRFNKLISIGFIASFATVLDDIVVFSPLFLGPIFTIYYSILGILFATVLEIILVIYFSEKIAKLKYKKEMTSVGLIILAVLMLFKII